LRVGETGERVEDVRRRLARLGYAVEGRGPYDEILSAAVAGFQRERGLVESGIVDATTWRTLVESGYRIGDRLLYLRRPPLRGDDVAWLQGKLGSLGFDPGRVDGIFGSRTRRALMEFQANVGLPADGMCGQATIEELRRVDLHHGTHVHGLIERLGGAHRRSAFGDVHVVVAAEVALEGVAELVGARVRRRGGNALVLASDDQSELARTINRAQPDVFVHFGYSLVGRYVAYYAGYNYVSPVGKELAEAIQRAGHLGDFVVRGMSIPVLRETRQPGVAIAMADPQDWWKGAPELGDGVVGAVQHVVCREHAGEREQQR
jgi:N-acetylmuramoyl-L-alanine amidase